MFFGCDYWTRGPAKSDTFSIFACHPCAGAMLIFSVSFQFLRMTPKSSELTKAHSFIRGSRGRANHLLDWGAQASFRQSKKAPRPGIEPGASA